MVERMLWDRKDVLEDFEPSDFQCLLTTRLDVLETQEFMVAREFLAVCGSRLRHSVYLLALWIEAHLIMSTL